MSKNAMQRYWTAKYKVPAYRHLLPNNAASSPVNGDQRARDCRATSAMVLQDLEDNLHHKNPAHREGNLRALTDLLSCIADGCGPSDDWDPIADTEAAFSVPRQQAAELMRRAAG